MKQGEEVSGKEGPIVERMHSKGEIRRQIVRLLSFRRKNLVKFRSLSCVLVSEGRGIH